MIFIGYHGDDGNAFCGSGQGQIYGPTFTTGDVIGCGLNLIEGSCFYTKNGHNLGTAFTGKNNSPLTRFYAKMGKFMLHTVIFEYFNIKE